MASYANNVAHQRLWTASLTAAVGTRGRILVDHSPGGLRLPDSSLIETPGTADVPRGTPMVTRGGQRIIGGTIASTDASAKDILIYRGTTLTTQSTGATGALAVATTSTITRASGSFIGDGWTIGSNVMIFGPGPVALDSDGSPEHTSAGAAIASVGVLAQVSAVAALTLTTNAVLTAETLTGCRLIRVAQVERMTVAANSGNAAATPSVALLGNANEADITLLSASDRGLSFGPVNVMIIAAQAAVSALPARIDFNAPALLY